MNILQPRIILGAFSIALLLLLASLAQEMNRRWQVQHEVAELESQVQAMQKDVTHLENLNQYFRTDDYQERLAREKLNYSAPGEQVVLIPENVSQAAAREANPKEEIDTSSIPERWWRTFFVDGVKS